MRTDLFAKEKNSFKGAFSEFNHNSSRFAIPENFGR